MIYTERSRQEDDLQYCPRRRYWKYHYAGFGIVRKEVALERDTGIYVHEVIKKVLRVIQLGKAITGDTQRFLASIPDNFRRQIRGFIKDSLAQYQTETRAAGFQNIPAQEVERLIQEQSTLIEGLCWAFVKVKLPTLLAQFDIVAIEEEEAIILDCTCGESQIGPTRELHDRHAAAGCQGIYHASRPDVVLRRREDGQLGNHDWKSGKYFNDWEVNRYRDSVQIAMGTVGAERRLGEPVTHYYIHFLLKGERKKSYIPAIKKFEGPKTQLSHLCYTTIGEPPLTDFFDTSTKWYLKVPVWELSDIAGKPDDWSNVEYLVEMLRVSVLTDMFGVVGPYDRQQHLIESYKRQLPPYERAWLRRVWAVYKRAQQGGEPMDKVLDEEVPASWHCFKYGADHVCEFYDLCHKNGVSADDPLASGLFVLRTPHHEDELRVAQESRKVKA